MKCSFKDIVLDSRTGLNPRKNFVLGSGNNAYITIKDIYDGKINISEKTDRVDDDAIQIIKRRSRISAGDILFVSIGRIGETAIVYEKDDSWDVNESIFIFTLNKELIIPEYFCLLFESKDVRNSLTKNSSGSTFKSIKMSQLEKMEFDVPPLQEQRTIVDRINKSKAIITLRKTELQKLDELVKARFVEMFGDVIHNDRNWEKHLFSDITTSRLGKMLDAKQQTGEYPFPYLGNANVQWFRFDTSNLNQMDFNEADQVEFALEDGDLLVCEGGEIGRCAVWHNQIQPCYFQKAIHRVRCNKQLVLPDYLAWWFKFNCEHNGFSAIEGAKATIAHLPGAKLKQLQVVVPPIELQNRFIDLVAQLDKSKVVVQKALDEAQLLFDSLMQQYFG